jgi:hypothetical protein
MFLNAHAQQMFATRPFVACVMTFSFGKRLHILVHLFIEYCITGSRGLDTSSYHAQAQLIALLKQAHAQESGSLTHWQLEASSTHALVQQRLLLPRTPCAAEGLINHTRMHSKCTVARAPCAAECLINPRHMSSKVRRCLVPIAQLKASSTHAHAQQCAAMLRAPCAAEEHINPMRMRSKCFKVSFV